MDEWILIPGMGAAEEDGAKEWGAAELRAMRNIPEKTVPTDRPEELMSQRINQLKWWQNPKQGQRKKSMHIDWLLLPPGALFLLPSTGRFRASSNASVYQGSKYQREW